MHPYFKLIMTLMSIGVAFLYGYTTKNKRKRIIGIMLILMVISTFSNQSIYWIIYWKGPYFGQVVDADTGQPIEGASVAGVWSFEHYFFFIAGWDSFANARETTTDSNGKFRFGPIMAFSLWPFSKIYRMDLVVFIPGYDSHPPAIIREMEKPEHYESTQKDGKYFIGDYVSCKAWRKCKVRLNKANNFKEELHARSKCRSYIGGVDFNEHEVRKFREVLDKSEFKYLRKKKFKPAKKIKENGKPVFKTNCHTFKAIHASEDGNEAVLRDKVTGDEWIVQAGDEIDGYRVTQVTMNYVTLIHSGENGVVYSTDIPIMHKKNIIKASP